MKERQRVKSRRHMEMYWRQKVAKSQHPFRRHWTGSTSSCTFHLCLRPPWIAVSIPFKVIFCYRSRRCEFSGFPHCIEFHRVELVREQYPSGNSSGWPWLENGKLKLMSHLIRSWCGLLEKPYVVASLCGYRATAP